MRVVYLDTPTLAKERRAPCPGWYVEQRGIDRVFGPFESRAAAQEAAHSFNDALQRERLRKRRQQLEERIASAKGNKRARLRVSLGVMSSGGRRRQHGT